MLLGVLLTGVVGVLSLIVFGCYVFVVLGTCCYRCAVYFDTVEDVC